jgi:hypothetical protein
MRKKSDPEPLENETAVADIEGLGEQLADFFASKYLAVGGKSVAAVVELAETVWQAGDELSPRQLRLFYAKVKLDPKGSTVVKFRAIGEQAERFRPHLDTLPNNWTSLYRLAKLPLEDFNALIAGGKLHSATTMNEINEALGKQTGKAKKRFKVVIEVGGVGEQGQQAALIQELAELAKKFKTTLAAPGHAEDLQKLLKVSVELDNAA